MSRKLIVFQVCCGEDMAQSDAFFPTLFKARAHLRQGYGIKGPIELDEKGEWHGYEVDENGDERFDVHLERLEIEATRDGLCYALKTFPNR